MKVNTLLISFFIFGIYSRFHLDIGPLSIPYFISFASGISLLVLNNFRVNKISLNFFIYSFLFSFIILVIHLLITKDVSVRSIIESYIFLIYSIFLALIFLDEISRWSNEYLSNYLYKSILLVLVLSVLDIIPIFHSLNLAILDIMGGHNQGEFAGDREAAIFFGVRRPFPLTKEPSHVSKYLFLALAGWFLLSKKKSYLKYIVLSMITLIVVRSSITIGSFIMLFIYFLTSKSSRQNLKRYASAIVLAAITTIILGGFLFKILEPRINDLRSGNDISTMNRLVRPVLILEQSIVNYPILGVGIGNTEKLAELYVQEYDLWVNEQLGDGYTISALLAPIAYWGLIGFFFFMIPVMYFLKHRFKIQNSSVLFIMYVLISLSMAAFNTVNYWAYIFLIFRFFDSKSN